MRKQLTLFFSIIISGLISGPSFGATAIEYRSYHPGRPAMDRQIPRGIERSIERRSTTPSAILPRTMPGAGEVRGPALPRTIAPTPSTGGLRGSMPSGR